MAHLAFLARRNPSEPGCSKLSVSQRGYATLYQIRIKTLLN